MSKTGFLAKYWLVAFLSLVYFIFVAWGIHLFREATVIVYPDSEDYHIVTLQPWISPDFWAGRRSLTTPFIWRLFQMPVKDNIPASYTAIPVFYTALSLLSWGVLAIATALVIRVTWLKVLAFFIVLGIGMSRMIFFWNWTLLSESPSISFFILLIAVGVLLIHYFTHYPIPTWKKQIVLALVVSCIVLLWSFTRDTNAFIALGLGGLLILFSAFRWKMLQARVFISVLTVAFIGIAVAQLLTVQIGKRWQYPFVNVLGQRILTNSEYTKYFTEQGLPQTPDVARFSGQWANTYAWSGLDKWLNTDARKTYLKFLLSHPSYTFLGPVNDWRNLIDEDWSNYGKKTVGNHLQNKITSIVWPRGLFLAITATLAFVLSIEVFLRRKLTPYLLLAFVLLLLVIPGVFATWHGDAMETVRHSVGNSLQLRIALLLMIIFSLDALCSAKNIQKSNQLNSPLT